MGFDFEERKSLLYADLFKIEENRENSSSIMPQWRSPSSSSACDSSSSGFTTPFGSELGSSESDDADFAAELSRQMAECMLHEEDEEEPNSVSHYGLNPNRPVLDHANRTPCVKLNNHSAVGDRVGVSRGRRVKGDELTQQMQTRKAERNYGRYRDAGRKRHTGSGMQAIFLGGPGSRNGSSGTGVFLPRVTNNPVEQKKKSGLSTVLIPTRVLEALELHFTRLSDSATPPLTTATSLCHASLRVLQMKE
ncbi:uncharacterized protein LOC131006771 isoform X2 [Salvia miltiorrhiza]|uniref:uncharacterized protein LOC131006771 isoform X2 n=1 Tax=Salvia miltiorrhiza TaxID=226208 RepID=UPI0025AB9FEE|nr:uncharacterized protein LOC131006771 isoform X2 [Salvia miltiorrhiza]